MIMGSEVELDVPSSPCSSDCSEVKAEQVWREGGEHLAMSRISEKVGARVLAGCWALIWLLRVIPDR